MNQQIRPLPSVSPSVRHVYICIYVYRWIEARPKSSQPSTSMMDRYGAPSTGSHGRRRPDPVSSVCAYTERVHNAYKRQKLIFKTPVAAAGAFSRRFRITRALPRERRAVVLTVCMRCPFCYVNHFYWSERVQTRRPASQSLVGGGGASVFAKREMRARDGRRILRVFFFVPSPLSPPSIPPPERRTDIVPVFGMARPIIFRAPRGRCSSTSVRASRR